MELSIISQLPESRNRKLRPYDIDGINTVGAFGDEPFAISFRNSSPAKVEVIISVDGRNVLTGREATLTDTRRFVVSGYETSTLEAWPETSEGGGRFSFTQEHSGVAAHTPGDLSAVGYISVAVFTEGAPRYSNPYFEGSLPGNFFEGNTRGGGYESLGEAPKSMGATRGATKSAVGVGEQISQHIGVASGLRLPVFDQTVQIRHIWWDDLVTRLRELGIQPTPSHPTGFFGTTPRPLADLGSAPRPGSTMKAAVIDRQEAYDRFI